MKKKNKLETAFKDLEKIVAKMESDALSLEEAIEYFSEGTLLVKECEQILTEGEQKLQVLEAGRLKPLVVETEGNS